MAGRNWSRRPCSLPPQIGRTDVHDHADAPGGGTIAHSDTTGQVATDHHTAAILASLLTTRGDIVHRGAAAAERVALGASGTVLTSDGTDAAWAAAAGGGDVTREGGQLTEATTTSTTDVDLLTASSLSIAEGLPIMVICGARKTAGGNHNCSIGFKVNATEVRATFAISGSTDQAENGVFWCVFLHGVASYLAAGIISCSTTGGANVFQSFSADGPAATITDLIIRGKVANAAITMAADDMHVYSLAVS